MPEGDCAHFASIIIYDDNSQDYLPMIQVLPLVDNLDDGEILQPRFQEAYSMPHPRRSEFSLKVESVSAIVDNIQQFMNSIDQMLTDYRQCPTEIKKLQIINTLCSRFQVKSLGTVGIQKLHYARIYDDVPYLTEMTELINGIKPTGKMLTSHYTFLFKRFPMSQDLRLNFHLATLVMDEMWQIIKFKRAIEAEIVQPSVMSWISTFDFLPPEMPPIGTVLERLRKFVGPTFDQMSFDDYFLFGTPVEYALFADISNLNRVDQLTDDEVLSLHYNDFYHDMIYGMQASKFSAENMVRYSDPEEIRIEKTSKAKFLRIRGTTLDGRKYIFGAWTWDGKNPIMIGTTNRDKMVKKLCSEVKYFSAKDSYRVYSSTGEYLRKVEISESVVPMFMKSPVSRNIISLDQNRSLIVKITASSIIAKILGTLTHWHDSDDSNDRSFFDILFEKLERRRGFKLPKCFGAKIISHLPFYVGSNKPNLFDLQIEFNALKRSSYYNQYTERVISNISKIPIHKKFIVDGANLMSKIDSRRHIVQNIVYYMKETGYSEFHLTVDPKEIIHDSKVLTVLLTLPKRNTKEDEKKNPSRLASAIANYEWQLNEKIELIKRGVRRSILMYELK